jgi:glucokinase
VERIIAIDIGGTKLSVGTVTTEGVLLERLDASAVDAVDGDELFGRIEGLLDRLTTAAGAIACGVGCGGPMTPGGEAVSPLNIAQWRDFPLRARVAAHLELPTWVDNDAKALALGEGWVGTATGSRNYLALVVSTGVGGGIVLDGRLLEGFGGNAGHIGHVIVEPDGHLCGCGARGCLEAEASGTAIARNTGRAATDATPEVVERVGRLVGRGVASVANLLDLQTAVVAGGVALGFGAPFFAAAQAEIDRRCRLDFSRGTRIVPGSLGSNGPVIGAARVAALHLDT